MQYTEATWETKETITSLSNGKRALKKMKSYIKAARKKVEMRKAYKEPDSQVDHEFPGFSRQPPFIKGSLYPYQLTGMSFLHSSWLKKKNVILAGRTFVYYPLIL